MRIVEPVIGEEAYLEFPYTDTSLDPDKNKAAYEERVMYPDNTPSTPIWIRRRRIGLRNHCGSTTARVERAATKINWAGPGQECGDPLTHPRIPAGLIG